MTVFQERLRPHQLLRCGSGRQRGRSPATVAPLSAQQLVEEAGIVKPAILPINAQLAESVPTDDLDAAFARFLRLDVANGDASVDTIRGYRSQLAAWVNWYADQSVDARTATVDDAKRYRTRWRCAPTTLPTGSPRPPDRRAPEDFGYLSEVELALLFRAVPHVDALKHLRDRALLGLLGLQALRTVEITRANVDDLQRHGDDWALLVHGKYHDRLVFFGPMSPTRFAPTWPRGSIPPDEFGEALLVADGNFARGHRLSRRGVPHVVDGYLRAAGVKRPQVSNHALRHTSATLAYRYTHDLRAVQDLPGSQDDRPLCARR